MKRVFQLLMIVLAAVVFTQSCKETDLDELRRRELKKLKEFIEKNEITVEPKPSGLYFIEREAGVGDSVQVGDKVQIFYTMWLIGNDLDSIKYEESGTYNPFEFVVGTGSSIRGIDEAVRYMLEGGKASLIIPSELGYGAVISSGLPRFSTLLYDIHLYRVFKANQY